MEEEAFKDLYKLVRQNEKTLPLKAVEFPALFFIR